MQAVTTIGRDIAKSVFQVHGIDAEGNVLIRRQLKRRYVLAFFRSCRDRPCWFLPRRHHVFQAHSGLLLSPFRCYEAIPTSSWSFRLSLMRYVRSDLLRSFCCSQVFKKRLTFSLATPAIAASSF